MQQKTKIILERMQALRLDAEQKLYFHKYGPVISGLRRDPVKQARVMHGIVVPPHERSMFRFARWDNFDEYHYVGSRGTAKSFVVASMIPTLHAEVFGRKKLSTLSASRFRGGKVIMEEATQLIFNGLAAQKEPAPFAREMLLWHAGVKKEADRWYIRFTNRSEVVTIPTGNEETARGLRAHMLFLDEADNWSKSAVDNIFGPFLAVRGDHGAPGRAGSSNKIFFTGTVSYTHKDWAKALKDRESLLRRRYLADQALEKEDYATYERILSEDDGRVRQSSCHVQYWDYTDLIIPTEFRDHDVFFPTIDLMTKSVVINSEDFVQYDPKDKRNLIYTYPIDKARAEKGLEDGLTDFDSWAAEWRCQFIETSGNVYPYDLIDKACSTELIEDVALGAFGWDVEERGVYFPPVLYECADPCVLGVDPARTNDFTAFVVIRLGELASGEYNPMTGTGATPWNNVIWAEQKRHMTIPQVAAKIRELQGRYNFHIPDNPELAPGVTIDARGAMSGTTVRDELAKPSPEVDELGNVNHMWVAPHPMYDPLDKEYVALKMNQLAWPGLRILWTSDVMNTELVSFSKGQFEATKLYIGKSLSKSERFDSREEMGPGYLGVRVLADQLVTIQGVPTKYAFTYKMPGDGRRLDQKKDMFSAFLYACFAVREHRKLLIEAKATPPVIAARVVRQGGRRRSNLYRDVFKRM